MADRSALVPRLRRGGQTQQAIEDRRREVRDFLAGLPEDSRVVFVELEARRPSGAGRPTRSSRSASAAPTPAG